jgi:carbon storage regulator
MLVIRRRAGEALILGEDIEIEVLEVCGSQVKLGIRAPQSVPVVRQEIQLAGRQNRAASASSERLLTKLERLRSSRSFPTVR